MAKPTTNPADYIQPLYINGLNGRMLHAQPRKAALGGILLVYVTMLCWSVWGW